ncbi:glycosyltransferase family 2 protein [Prosthecodimorpha staleyi]|uniref:Glycosyltransferase family 2 protein n=1 Tax=Prosthecodimorpha staleyi TaxID=2840188 RepID=A0A947GG93_9HYPH|nr:glycosyltransferase family 2 protein [Prosthecodimorpha staleyi]MBT9291725.1 glycosyltransferase family 2 protein [Prosthecodimorpha staleyi]
MTVHLYTRCWNDADMLGFMFRHYDPVVDRYFVYDDGSTDGSIEILRAHPKVTLRTLPPGDPKSRILSSVRFSDQVWHESRGVADWVIVADIDEHLYHPDLERYLAVSRERVVTLIPALGYQMISAQFPEPADLLLCAHLTRGAPWVKMSKLGLFDPDRIEATNYATGRHSCQPTGEIRLPPRDELLLLHYKYLDFERTQRRHEQSGTRSRELDIAKGWGKKYFWSREQLAEDWNAFERATIDIADSTIDHHRFHRARRWWRDLPRVADAEV